MSDASAESTLRSTSFMWAARIATTEENSARKSASDTPAESHAYQRTSRRASASASRPPPSEPIPPASAAIPPNAMPASPAVISNTRRR